MLPHPTPVLALAVLLAAGCAEHTSRVGRGGFLEVPPPVLFWPPAPPTSACTGTPRGDTFGDVAERLKSSLRDAGYRDLRWFPVGHDFVHGFAIATRLERIDDDGAASPNRWSSLYPEAPDLPWLDFARAPRLPGAGRYRVFLLAFSDLPTGHADDHSPPRWNDETVMDAANLPPMIFPKDRRVSRRFAITTLVYEYASPPDADVGAFLASDARLPAQAQVRAANLASIAAWSSTENRPLE